MENAVRLNKYISSHGILSRRKIDEYILQGRVTVNNKTVYELGLKVEPEIDKVCVDGEQVRQEIKKIYILLNKPKGVVTTVSDDKKRTTVIDLIGINKKIFPVGRLDYNTGGLLLLTNDGEFANALMKPENKIYKTYFVQLSKPLEERIKKKISAGIMLDGRKTRPAVIKFLYKNDFTRLYISIQEGRNRQIHNMFEKFGYYVRELYRTEYAGLVLGGLKEGHWRYLNAGEVNKLKSIIKN
ncbi:MAG: Ribosomal large subunit pseudouridine synthase B [Ignavibacteria bacterium]|nr:Ribosomal large subunit pseudouridine synthase B [Ignavibacteria bacterium]